MPKEEPNKKYTPEFKKLVVETMQAEKLGYRETAKRFGIRHKRVQDWVTNLFDRRSGGLFDGTARPRE